jgi:hypothetical protein
VLGHDDLHRRRDTFNLIEYESEHAKDRLPVVIGAGRKPAVAVVRRLLGWEVDLRRLIEEANG